MIKKRQFYLTAIILSAVLVLGAALTITTYASNPLTVDFTADPTKGPAPLAVSFSDESSGTGIEGRAWYFGDETFSDPWEQFDNFDELHWRGRNESSAVTLSDGTIVLMGGSGGGIRRNDVWRSGDGGETWELVVAEAEWSGRSGHAAVVVPGDGLNGESIVLVGGTEAGFVQKNDVWRSDDGGESWTELTGVDGADWSERMYHAAVTLIDGSIVIMGGWKRVIDADNMFYNDVWRSTDGGESWNELTGADGADWSERESPAAVVLSDGSIVLMGGIKWGGSDEPDIYHNDVWRSEDNGATWTEVTGEAEWPARWRQSAVLMPGDGGNGESIILMGGWKGVSGAPNIYYNDVWRSDDDGETWTEVIGEAEWTGRYSHSSVIYDGKIVLIGGYDGRNMNDVWRSADGGENWEEFVPPFWPARNAHATAVLPDGTLVLMGGFSGQVLNDVWRSTDEGQSWERLTAKAPWFARDFLKTVVLSDGSIVLMGGYGDEQNDVWRSEDGGENWIEETDEAQWPYRYDPAVVALPDDSIILMGGIKVVNGAVVYLNDVWRSTDGGANWIEVTGEAEWPARRSHEAVVLSDGSIVLMGGSDASGTAGDKNDVWRSADGGASWDLVTAEAEWDAMAYFSSLVLPDDTIVVFSNSDIWFSRDGGAVWEEMTGEAGWLNRSNISSVVLPDGDVLVLGGRGGSFGMTRFSDVWRLETAGSKEVNPTHTYQEPGIYNVALRVYTENQYDTEIKKDLITAGKVTRLSGANRYITAVEISKNGWDSADTVVLARGDDYADALAGVPLAYHLDAPILLTPTTALNNATGAEIARLGADKVILLGGRAAISDTVKDELEGMGLTVERISGTNRYHTAVRIAERLENEGVTFDTAFIAVGTSFADALAASSYAAMRGEPILLTETNSLPPDTEGALNSLGISNTYVCGGSAAVGSDVYDMLPNPKRISGANRYATALALAEEFLPDDADHVGIATGLNFPDAIAGGVWAAKHHTGILLVDGRAGEPGSAVQVFLNNNGITAATLFGGSGVISSSMAEWFEANLED